MQWRHRVTFAHAAIRGVPVERRLTPAPIASEALKQIAAFYAIEKEIRGRSAEERRLVRQQKSRPLADAFEAWLRAKAGSHQPEDQASPMPSATPSRAGKD